MSNAIQPVAVLNVVGLSSSLMQHAPNLKRLAEQGMCRLDPVLPAVTCSVQSSMLTGLPVGSAPTRYADTTTSGGHGIVGNGWFSHEQQEIQFWKQSNKLVQGEKVWDTARRAAQEHGEKFTVANLFWWFNMYASVDFAVTPRPQYRADGAKVPDIWTHPASLRDDLQRDAPEGLGRFPLFNFWGPMSDVTSSRWIADATKHVVEKHDPTLSLVYLPHLDYGLQKLGPSHPDIAKHVEDVDEIAGDLIDYFRGRGRRVIVVSEYGIEAVDTPIHVNRHLRDAGLLAVREENEKELLDAGASRAFAVADHQVAHVYHGPDVELPAIPHCTKTHIAHPRAGNTVLVANRGAWFTYDYWPADQPHKAPDFARTVEIHRKPGYDPRELFLGASKTAVAWKLIKRKLGMRQPLDVIPLDATLVKGSHGRPDVPEDLKPLMLGVASNENTLPCTAVYHEILSALFPTDG